MEQCLVCRTDREACKPPYKAVSMGSAVPTIHNLIVFRTETKI